MNGKALGALFALFLSNAVAAENSLTGIPTEIVDGDTIALAGETIRLLDMVPRSTNFVLI